MNNEIFRACSNSLKTCRPILVHKIDWMVAKSGDMLLVRPSQECQNLAPEADVNVAPQHKRSDVCSNEGTIQCPGYLHGYACKPWMCLGIQASKCKCLEEIPICLMG